MSVEMFEALYSLRSQLVALGLESLLDSLAEGDEDAVDAALEGLCSAV